MVSLVENLYYIERKQVVWGAEPPSAAGAEKFLDNCYKTPPLCFGKKRVKGGGL